MTVVSHQIHFMAIAPSQLVNHKSANTRTWNDWLVGTGSHAAGVRRGGFLVYAMRVTEILSTEKYWLDPRFRQKKPNMHYNWVAASGDNIYQLIAAGRWRQLNSYHSHQDGSPRRDHLKRDTRVQRILVSDDFVYFGGEGPRVPDRFYIEGEERVVCTHRHYRKITQESLIAAFVGWTRSLDVVGFQGKPWDWVKRRT